MTLKDGTLEEFGYEWIANPHNDGNSYIDPGYYPYPWRIALHETDSATMSPGGIAAHPYPPQIWYNPITRARYQTIRLTRAALALYQPDYGYHWCNRSKTLQVEITGITGYSPDETDAMLRNIAADVIVPLVLFVRSQGADIQLRTDPRPPGYGLSASVDWPYRMTEQAWADCNYVTSHLFVWGQDHWDVGAMRTDLIVKYAAADARLSGHNPPPEEDDDFMAMTPEQINALIEASSYTVAANGDGRLEVFRTVGGKIQHRWQHTAGGGWSDWQEMFTSPPPAPAK